MVLHNNPLFQIYFGNAEDQLMPNEYLNLPSGKDILTIEPFVTNLQKFIDIIYPHILESFKYKTILYYKSLESEYILNDLLNTEHIIKSYNNVEDIVRHS